MGGELGTRVALLLQQERGIAAVGGIDIDPPRRRLQLRPDRSARPGAHRQGGA
jgi:hypothetical protein